MKLHIPVIILFFLSLTGCKREEHDAQRQTKDLGSLYVTFPNGKGHFNPVNSTPYTDTIVFEFPTHFPLESDNVFDIRSMLINTLSPSKVEVVGQSENMVDMSKDIAIIIHKGNGQSSRHIIKSVIKKSSEADLFDFSLPEMNLEGFITGNQINLIASGADLSNLTPVINISTRASIFPLPSTPQNFNQPVEYTVTAQDGVTEKKYTVKFATPQKVEYGIRMESIRKLWSKSLAELGINATDHMTTSLAVSQGNLVINTREQRNKILNRFNGKLLGEMIMGNIANETFRNFFVTSDQKGQLLISNLVAAPGNQLTIYKWKNSTDSNPIKIITWTMQEAWNAGRKMSVVGDLEKTALIYVAASNSGNTVLRWIIKNGQVVSQTPERLSFPGTTNWTQMADIAPAGFETNSPVFITGHPGNVSYWDIANNSVPSELSAINLNLVHNNAIDYVEFNKARFISFGKVEDRTGEFYLYDVTQHDNLNAVPASEHLNKSVVFRTGNITTNGNGNRTSDVVVKASDDGYKLHMYCLLTNGSVVAYEFDCIDFDTL